MKSIRKFAILITISPIIFLLIIALLNFRNQAKIRLLTWVSPQVSIGYLILSSTALGYFCGSLNVLSLNMNSPKLRNKIIYNKNNENNDNNDQIYDEPFVNDATKEDFNNYSKTNQYIERDPRDPTPTITIPYRVIQKPTNNEVELSEISPSNIRNEVKYHKNNVMAYDEDGWGGLDLENW